MKVPDFNRLTSHPKVTSAQRFSALMAPYWIGAAITAVLSIAYAKVFAYCELNAIQTIGPRPEIAFVTAPAVIMLSMFISELFSPTAAGSGIPQLIAGMELSEHESPYLKEIFGFKMIVAKFIGSCVCVIGGGVTGREGPNLQMSAGIFQLVHRWWPKTKAKLEIQPMILAGGAAGLAAAFNTPLGGVVFAIEELAKVHISRVRTAIFHAVIISGLCVQAILGNYLYIGKATFKVSGALEVIELAFGALFIGAVGALFGFLCFRVLAWRGNLPKWQRWGFSLACALGLAGMIQIFGVDALGSGREVLRSLLTTNAHQASETLGFVRVIANLLTYSAGVIGGIFAPALSSGAGFGIMFSDMVASQNPQLWILVGMTAFLTGVTRTPFTSTILVLEMTDSHEVIVFLMLASMMAQGSAKLVDPLSFYERASKKFIKTAEQMNPVAA